MKNSISIFFLLTGFAIYGQGTFVYDQQSSTEAFFPGDAVIQVDQPGQSFTPGLSAIDFIRLYLGDNNPGNALGATVRIDLRTNSISGPVIASTDPVFMADG